MPTFEHQGCELHYQVERPAGGGCDDAPPVMLIAGFNGSGEFWEPLRHAWHAARVPATLVLPDYRGAGRSGAWPQPGPTGLPVDLLADDMLAVLRHAGVARAHVIGHSYGSVIAQVMAARSPGHVTSLTLSATFSHADTTLARWFELRLSVLSQAGPQAFVELGTLLSHAPQWLRANWAQVREREARQVAALHHSGAVDAVVARARGLLAADTRALLAHITAPTLVLAARDDVLTPPELSREVADGIARARMVLFDEGGHSFVRVYPQQYLQHWLQHGLAHPAQAMHRSVAA